jgi:hypothetical protein
VATLVLALEAALLPLLPVAMNRPSEQNSS